MDAVEATSGDDTPAPPLEKFRAEMSRRWKLTKDVFMTLQMDPGGWLSVVVVYALSSAKSSHHHPQQKKRPREARRVHRGA